MGFWAYHDARDIMQMLGMLLFATANQNPEKFCSFTTSYVSHATYEVLKLKRRPYKGVEGSDCNQE